jgi:hypothetical protein
VARRFRGFERFLKCRFHIFRLAEESIDEDDNWCSTLPENQGPLTTQDPRLVSLDDIGSIDSWSKNIWTKDNSSKVICEKTFGQTTFVLKKFDIKTFGLNTFGLNTFGL